MTCLLFIETSPQIQQLKPAAPVGFVFAALLQKRAWHN